MAPDTGVDGEPVEDCTTTGAFSDHGIDDGSDLLQRTYYRLADSGVDYEPTEAFFADLEAAFLWAYLETAGGTDVPAGVQAAAEDARVHVAESFADRHGADLRTEVVPAFYREVAGFHCAYRG